MSKLSLKNISGQWLDICPSKATVLSPIESVALSEHKETHLRTGAVYDQFAPSLTMWVGPCKMFY